MNEATWQWNVSLFRMIHATDASPAWLVQAGRILTDAPLVPAALLTLWLVWRRDDATTAVRVVFACILVAASEALVRTYAGQPRPFAAGMGPAWLAHVANNSMPSTHVGLVWGAGVLASLAGQLRLSAMLLALGLATGWARVYVGIQWPADILGSALFACLAAAGGVGLEKAARACGRVFGGRSPAPPGRMQG